MIKSVYTTWQKIGLKYFWGDLFDSRFYIVHLVTRRKSNMILDIGCGAGVILHFAKSDLKIGLDYSFDSLKKAKELDSRMELIQGDAQHLPFRNNMFSNILAIHIISAFQSEDEWNRVSVEMKRIATENSEIIIAGANRTSKHFKKTHTIESRQSYLHYNYLIKQFNDFDIILEGYSPHSRFLMFPFKILLKIPDKVSEMLGIERALFYLLRSKRYLKNGRSYIMICKKKSK